MDAIATLPWDRIAIATVIVFGLILLGAGWFAGIVLRRQREDDGHFYDGK